MLLLLPNVRAQEDLMVAALEQLVAPAPSFPFSALLIPLPPALSQVLRALARAIPDQELTEQGRELYPHVTVLDGLDTADPELCRPLVEAEPPFVLHFGRTSAFAGTHCGRPFDVLKVDIESDALARIHRRLAARLPHTRPFPDYVPHATIAFLQPGCAARYTGQAWLEGWSAVVDRLVFSTPTRQTTELPLRGTRPIPLPSTLVSPAHQWAA